MGCGSRREGIFLSPIATLWQTGVGESRVSSSHDSQGLRVRSSVPLPTGSVLV